MLANLSRLERMLAEQNLDAVIGATQENIHYLTGISSVALEMFPHTGQCYAVSVRGGLERPAFISSRCEVDQLLDSSVELAATIGHGTFYREQAPTWEPTPAEERLREANGDGETPRTPYAALQEALRRLGCLEARIAVDEDGVSREFFDAAADLMPKAEFVPGADLLRKVRQVKTPQELERLRRSAQVAERGIAAALAEVREGVTEQDLVRAFEVEIVRHGARPKFSLIKFGRRAVAGQSRPSAEPLQKGESIWFDVGCVVDGYWADIARTYVWGEPSAKQERYYSAMLAGEEAALKAARPGMTGAELFELTVNAVREAGVPHYRRNHVGHGIGVEVYDRVLLRPDCSDVIEEGTVVNIETPYYEFGFGAVHVEDPFVVTATGNRLLTDSSRNLGVI